MGQGYPPKDAKRKQLNTKQVKQLNKICKLSFEQVLAQIPSDLLDPILNYAPVCMTFLYKMVKILFLIKC